MMKKNNKLTKVLGASVIASSLLFPTTAQAAIDASNITVDPAMENDIVAKINAIREANHLPLATYSSALSEQSKHLLAGAESVNSRFTNGSGSAHHYNNVINYNTNEVWSSIGMTSGFALEQWITEVNSVTSGAMHCITLLTASEIGGALATENGQTLYVSTYTPGGNADIDAKARAICTSPLVHAPYGGNLANAYTDVLKTGKTEVETTQPVSTPVEIVTKQPSVNVEVTSIQQPQVSVEEVTSVAQPQPKVEETVSTTQQPAVSVEEVTSVAKPAPESKEVTTKVEQPQVSVEEVTSVAKSASESKEVTTKVEQPQASVEEVTSTKKSQQVSTVPTSVVKPIVHQVATNEQKEVTSLVDDLTKQAIEEDVVYIDQVINALKALPQTKEITDLINQIEKAKNDALAMKDDTKVLECLDNIIGAFEKLADEEATEVTSTSTVTESKSTDVKQTTTVADKHNVDKPSVEKTVKRVVKNPNKKMELPKTGVGEETSYAQMGLFGLLLAVLGFGLRRKAK